MNNGPRRHAVHFDGRIRMRSIGKLRDIDYLQRLLAVVIRRAGMEQVNQTTSFIPVDVRKLGRDQFEDEGGTSIMTRCIAAIDSLITTSHVALHVWPERGCFMFDLVSCRAFDQDETVQTLLTELDVERTNHLTVVVDDRVDRTIPGGAADS